MFGFLSRYCHLLTLVNFLKQHINKTSLKIYDKFLVKKTVRLRLSEVTYFDLAINRSTKTQNTALSREPTVQHGRYTLGILNFLRILITILRILERDPVGTVYRIEQSKIEA